MSVPPKSLVSLVSIFMMVFASLMPAPRIASASAAESLPAADSSAETLGVLVDYLTLPLCPTVTPVNPYSPAFLGYGPVTFQVLGAPAQAASSKMVLFDITTPMWGGMGVLDLDPYNIYPSLPDFSWRGNLQSYNTQPGPLPGSVTSLVDLLPPHPGTYNWMLVFFDAYGNPLATQRYSAA